MYDEGIGPLVLNADDLAELLKPALQILLGRVLAVALDVDLWISDPC